MEGNTARALRAFTPRLGPDDDRRRRSWARRDFLYRRGGFLRQPTPSARAVEMWNHLLDDHDGDTASALGELVATLVDAGLLTEERLV